MLIEGSVQLVTGSSRGLGRALTSSLIERGARRVYAGTRHLEDDMVQDTVPIRLDVTSKCEIEESVQTCSDVNLIFNNAVEARFSSLLSSEAVPDARAQMETNYFGPLSICQSFAPVLARNGGGAIVNICSIVSFFNAPTMASFCPTKAALWSMTNGFSNGAPDLKAPSWLPCILGSSIQTSQPGLKSKSTNRNTWRP